VTGPAGPVAAVRTAVRRALAPVGLRDGDLVLVACSGGADSLALAAATAFVAPRAGLRAGLVTVDHGLQEGSAGRAAEVVAWAGTAGLEPATTVTVDATPRGEGPEAAARTARYRALAGAARAAGAAAVLLGHTRDDQAETVLLALARGAGLRGIAGMPPARTGHAVTFLRPLLDVPRAQTRAACRALDLSPWEDPHNSDPAYARARVRAALPLLTDLLGAGVVGNLARTARLAAADLDTLDELAAAARAESTTDRGLSVPVLATLPGAIRSRVLRGYALDLGAPAGALGAVHVTALDALVSAWHGQGPVALPGGHHVARINGHITRIDV
jgi:tRNA(Ile)-lysidine synthase